MGLRVRGAEVLRGRRARFDGEFAAWHRRRGRSGRTGAGARVRVGQSLGATVEVRVVAVLYVRHAGLRVRSVLLHG